MATGAIGPEACEEAFAGHLSKAYEDMARFFKDGKMKKFEDMAKKADSDFRSVRKGITGRTNDYESAVSSTEPVEDGLVDLESAFIEEYKKGEMDEPDVFTHAMSLFREAKYRLAMYRGAVAALACGRAGGRKAASTKVVEKAKEEYADCVKRFHETVERDGALAPEAKEGITDVSSTILRYFDLSHEALGVELLNKSSTENPLERILRITAQAQSQLSDLRSKSFHAKKPELQKMAAEATIAFNAYRGAFAALFALPG